MWLCDVDDSSGIGFNIVKIIAFYMAVLVDLFFGWWFFMNLPLLLFLYTKGPSQGFALPEAQQKISSKNSAAKALLVRPKQKESLKTTVFLMDFCLNITSPTTPAL